VPELFLLIAGLNSLPGLGLKEGHSSKFWGFSWCVVGLKDQSSSRDLNLRIFSLLGLERKP